jgi:lysylphosphatidylglycerol synthetase-like protein (DUF2156 family)
MSESSKNEPTPQTPSGNQTPSGDQKPPRGQMLPGIAGISMFLLLVTLLNVFAALSGRFGNGAVKYGVLALCTILVGGIFGLLRMRRWGHSIVLAGCLLLSASYFYVFSKVHALPAVVQGFFALVFFLYLVRPEVRDRMR